MALTADRLLDERCIMTIDMPAGASDIFYAGAIIVVTAGTYAGGVVATDAATKKFVGVNRSHVDNSSGSAGDKTLDLLVIGECNFVAASAAAATWVGQKVYAVDDGSVALTATTTHAVEVGMVTKVISATEVRVLINVFGAVGA